MNIKLAVAIALVAPSLLPAQPAFTDRLRAQKFRAAYPAIDSVFSAYAQRENIPGAVWGIVIDGRLAHVGVAGVRDVESKAPVNGRTLFRIASMTKSFTAMAIMKLRDDGRLSLDDPAEKYVPELRSLRYPTTDSPRITVRHLMSHAAGFPEDNPWGDQQLAVSDAEMSRMMREGIPFSNAPGMVYEYSNYGFAILGRIVTNASGMPYRQYIEHNILRPLGMTSTTFEPGSVAADRLAQGYRWEDNQWKLEPQLPDGAFGAMGGMLTTIEDLGVYVGALLGAFPPRDGAETGPIRRSSLREMQQVHNPRAPFAAVDANGLRMSTGGYGYGLGISSNCTYAHIVAHSGGLPGFGSLMRWYPEYGVGIIAFGNRTYTGWGRPAEDALKELALTGALQPRVQQPSAVLVGMRVAVTRLVLNWDQRLADSVAAVNLFMDRSADRREREIKALIAKAGPCNPRSTFDYVENALRGEFFIPCQRGRLRVQMTLAPTTPPRVQHLEVFEAPLTGAIQRGRMCTSPP